jgi:hypothetical protein
MLAILFIVVACCFSLLVVSILVLPLEDEDEPRFASDSVVKDYAYIHELIEGAATKEEIAFLTDMALDFELDHRGKCDVKEYFTDLMQTIHQRDLAIKKFSRHQIA